MNFLRPKIKQIFQRVLAGIFHPKLVLGVVLFLFVFVYCFSHTNTVKAEDYDYSKFKLSTAININGTPGNFIKVVSGQPINLQATIKIDAPDAGIILNGDTRIDFRWVKGVGTAAAQIKEVGLGVESVYEESKDCSQMSNWSGENYVACSFDTAKYVIAKNQLTDGKTIPAGKEFAFNITLDSSKLEKLGLLKHKDSSNVGSFTIQPYFLLDFPYSIDFEGSTFLTKPNNVVFVGKEVYVQFFSTQAELTASGDNKPNTVPNYGSITSGVQETQIRGIPKLINDLFTAAAQFVISGIFSIFTTLIAPMLTGVLSVRVYTDAFVNVIYPGWEVLRNVVNIYFIVAIIAIALATLFRVESYKFRPLLIKLIIAALIVNFSLVVCQVILAVADTLQSQFLPNNAEVIGALAKDLMPAQIADIIRSNQLVTNSVFGTAVTTLFLMSMAIGGFLVFVAILGYLFIRIVMIWIFLILSPLAFAADVLPATSSMGQKWWGDFIKYAFFTPVMAFFLNMAAVIAVNYESIFGSISTNLVYGSSDYSKFTVLILATASNILLLAFLFGAINIAQSFGVFGANVVDGVFKTGVFAPFVASGAVVALGGKGGKTLLGFGAEKFHEKTGIEIRPKEWLEGWKHSREENKLKRKALGQAKALARGSPLGNPTSFFQRYWNIPTVKRLIKGGDRKGRRLISEAAKVKSDYLKKKNEFDLERRKPNPDQAKLHRLKEEMEELKHHYRHLYHEGHLLLAPVDYHTQKEFRGNVDQEKNKIHTKNWHELWDLFQAARHEKEAIRATAILKKVTETYNENEFINNSRYTRDLKARESAEWGQILANAKRENKTQTEITALGEQILHKQGEFFSMSPEGAENFRRLILEEELGLGEQVSMQVMSDVSDTAEDKNHRILMRMYGSKDGKLYFKSTNEREPEVRAENNKLNAESFLNGCNRLGGFMEVPDDDYDLTENRKAVATAPVLAYYLEHSSDIDPLIRRGRINTSQAKALAENYDIFVRAAEVFNDDIDPKTNELRLYEDLNVAITVPKEILEQGDDAVIKYKTERGGYKTKKALYLQGIAKVKEKGLSLTSDSEGKSTIDKAMEFVHK